MDDALVEQTLPKRVMRFEVASMDPAALRLGVAALVLAGFGLASTARAQDPSPLTRVEALGLDTLPVSWFEELLSNYVAYAYVRTADPEWARADRASWRGVVESFTPAVLSLDWGFMNDLPPDELARTYGWYQNLLNLRAADEHGLDFLRALKSDLEWEEAGDWTTESLMPSLEEIAPGFRAWSDGLQRGEYP